MHFISSILESSIPQNLVHATIASKPRGELVRNACSWTPNLDFLNQSSGGGAGASKASPAIDAKLIKA